VNTVDDGANDPHAGNAGDIGDDMMQLHIHLHERLLHVLNVRGCVIDDALSVTEQRA
jgi:hypothetical protein